MGFWHTSNQDGDGPNSFVSNGESVKRNDMRICSDECSANDPCIFNATNPISPGSIFVSPLNLKQSTAWRSGRPPLKDFVGSDSLLEEQDYVNYPDLQMFPSMAGPVVPIYNIPEINKFRNQFILSRLTLAKIFCGI